MKLPRPSVGVSSPKFRRKPESLRSETLRSNSRAYALGISRSGIKNHSLLNFDSFFRNDNRLVFQDVSIREPPEEEHPDKGHKTGKVIVNYHGSQCIPVVSKANNEGHSQKI